MHPARIARRFLVHATRLCPNFLSESLRRQLPQHQHRFPADSRDTEMRRLARIVPSVSALLLLTLLASSRVAVASESTCVNGGQQNPDIAAGKSALQRSPTQLGKRLEVANL